MVMQARDMTAVAMPRRGRILALDQARTAALVAMAIFHFAYDLETFGYLAPGTVLSGAWRALALGTAGSFLFLAGVSLWLAHGQGVRWPAFWRRFLKIAAAAALITAVTWVAIPQAFIFFGILHCIAAASLVGMLVLRLPAVALIGLAALAFAAPEIARSDLFNPWPLWWTGLQRVPVIAVDYVPLLPWVGPLFLGIAAGRIGTRSGLWTRAAGWQGGAAARALAWPGSHSLAIYLLHQPVLIALIWSYTQLMR
ncbi:hypothetical protein roselon_03324 [Roseibacterium elongatum DSM 19469]|uniref:Heparan-alpha-glucosaminide N-acetyltransferase catalytic domain-containing protein n=1 Tax=Roseicyclus elongatus DSM 19469 TaxID=1294273 RepID=W8S5S9_9RHOB|nr:heparan-alpha-glucosaminide N-acetyltransferase [Roseibacterium elongatum]AHM05582.1 hypothetical protein roselon_03324 [Roseibacterium elongatum DSM 19469]